MRATEICRYASTCSGCSYWGIPYATQLNRKVSALKQDWDAVGLGRCPDIEALSLADRGLRDRLDFRWQGGQMGLFDRNRQDVVDLPDCLQLSDALAEWLTEFRKFRWPFARASIRLRVSPTGVRGVWFDLANIDVQSLFAEEKLLRELLDIAVVEVGQRRKRLVYDEAAQKLKLLKEPDFGTWNRTWMGDTPVSLYSRIADFSQPGDRINQLLVNAVARHLDHEDIVMDWGAGAGNLSLPAAAKARQVWALDQDESALNGLKKTLQVGFQHSEKIQVQRVDFHRVGLFEEISRQQELGDQLTWIVDPPRSGAGALFFDIPKTVNKIVSVSCFDESFLQDSFELKNQGFQCESLALVDQFPQTPHGEWVSLWKR